MLSGYDHEITNEVSSMKWERTQCADLTVFRIEDMSADMTGNKDEERSKTQGTNDFKDGWKIFCKLYLDNREAIGRKWAERDSGHRRADREGELITRFGDFWRRPFGLTTMIYGVSWNTGMELWPRVSFVSSWVLLTQEAVHCSKMTAIRPRNRKCSLWLCPQMELCAQL